MDFMSLMTLGAFNLPLMPSMPTIALNSFDTSIYDGTSGVRRACEAQRLLHPTSALFHERCTGTLWQGRQRRKIPAARRELIPLAAAA